MDTQEVLNPNADQVSLQITIRAGEPNSAIATLQDIAEIINQTIDTLGDGRYPHIDDDDLPIQVWLNHRRDSQPVVGHAMIYMTPEPKYPLEEVKAVPGSNFFPGQIVNHITTGMEYTIIASIHLLGASNHPQHLMVISPNNMHAGNPDAIQQTTEQNQLMHHQNFEDLYFELEEITGHQYTFNENIGMWLRNGYPSMRLRINDVLNMIRDHDQGNKVPF